MSRFHKLSHVLWHCQYHLVWCPKYRFRVMTGAIGQSVHRNTKVFAGRLGCDIVELKVLADHVHLIIKVPPKVSISQMVGTVKGRTAINLFREFPHLRRKRYWGNRFWAPGYCVDTVGLDAEMIRKYVLYQEQQERRDEQLRLRF